MRWIVFIVALLAAFPAGQWLRARPAFRVHAWTLVGFLPFVSSLDIALFSFGNRWGDTNGIEVALIDWLALSLLLAHRGPARPVPNRLALAAYLVVALVSVTQAQWTLGAFGYVWKLCRMYLVYAVVCRAADDDGVPAALLRGTMFGIVYESGWVLYQHFGLGVQRASGTFAHGNTLGMLVNLAVMVPIALFLAGRPTRLTIAAIVAAVPACLFTVSRAAVVFFAAGASLVYVGSVLTRYTARKVRIGVIGLALAVAMIPLALATLSSRSGEFAASNQQRWQYESAASMMLQDHPLGVGPNHFTTMLLHGGYGDRAGINWTQRTAIVHNIYWLTAAEMGYAGVVALALLFVTPLLSAVRYGALARRDRRCDILLGAGAGMAMLFVHSFFEWAWRATAVSYVYWLDAAIIAVLVRQLRQEASRAGAAGGGRRARPSGSPALRPGGALAA